MALLTTFILSLFGLFAGLITSNFQGAQQRGTDTVAKNDINSTFTKLEEHYNENGDYPTEKQLAEQGADIFPGIDPEALIDSNGVAIFERASEYFYIPSECSATGCQGYELGTTLGSEEIYVKQSLN